MSASLVFTGQSPTDLGMPRRIAAIPTALINDHELLNDFTEALAVQAAHPMRTATAPGDSWACGGLPMTRIRVPGLPSLYQGYLYQLTWLEDRTGDPHYDTPGTGVV